MTDLYPWLTHNFSTLNHALKNSPHHAYLVSGNKGLGKFNLVKQAVKYYLCEQQQNQQSCNQCRSCKLINANNHPDIYIVNDKDGEKHTGIIKIDQIRTLSNKLSSTAQISATKIIIIQPADSLNTQATNSFLKTLEEPQGKSLFFLITDKPYAMPATIISRCLKMPIKNIDENQALVWLKQNNDEQSANIAYKINHQAPLQASQFLKNNLLEKRNDCFSLFHQICLKKQPLGSLAKWQEKEKLPLDIIISWLNSWLQDLCKLSLGITEAQSITNSDVLSELQNINQSQAIKNIFKKQKRTSKIQVLNKSSLNEKLILTDLLANIVMD